jgi:hypothetical protein
MSSLRGTNLCLVVALLVAVACHDDPEVYTSIEAVKSPLIGDLTSYMTPDQASTRLPSDILPWEIVEESKPPARDTRPPYDILTVTVRGFKYLAQNGELRMTFFNRRLASTWFFPQDGQTFLEALRLHGIDLIDTQEDSVAPYTRIWTAKTYQGKMYVAWEDTRLRRQSNRWIGRYA